MSVNRVRGMRFGEKKNRSFISVNGLFVCYAKGFGIFGEHESKERSRLDDLAGKTFSEPESILFRT